ncbi:AI-2E family transporter [Microbacterium sp. 3J1]|uniref:AI-2E family transporter n=1 Tax=Microbacterium sp. 3J1 TaxID=861269 RepID=UPI00210010C1|nr:AI-2E family transporter [Microbacterium sp. 3J1]
MIQSPRGAAERRLRSGSGALVSLGCAVLVLLGVHLARSVVAPLALAIVVVIICLPIGEAVARRAGHRWVGTTAIIVLAYGVVLAAGALIWLAAGQFAGLIADLGPGGALDHVRDSLRSWGAAVFHGDVGGAQPDLSVLLDILETATSALVSAVVALFFVCAYVVVMAVDAGRYAGAADLYGSSRAGTIARARRLNQSIRRYYLVNGAFGAIVATIDGLALWMLGVPAPVVWAILAFVTNFVPSIGFVIGVIPPAVLALAIGGWPLFLGVIAVYSTVNVVLQVFLQPKFVSDAVGLSLTVSFFAVVFWTFVIGPVGAILAVPLTLLARTLLFEGRADMTWWRWLSGDDQASSEDPSQVTAIGRTAAAEP